ncbi:FLYWCH zinc finger domain-containing protein [Ditylenchus destructor]|uniref:FLYWCH zinc finger domain-containing protein n=1 Tax=Ditylenchus destructor TaxID=166010 RepID=A0AAD4NFP7_9BILA|nr:FLYWCH zinc finger domain-containing protein [Ditylenchus destructor]
MVTSFKGNQKLIFEGYRYNIHHIVPTKGVKTWRCVCAKKLTSARSWCKGRAETWDNDSHGISKGEHNHPAEHEVAELEYFKSQLILAAIANPTAQLNDLIDEASTFMSSGVTFGSRESLKKSLTVARKSAENGGFKLKCYKNSDPASHANLSSSSSAKVPKQSNKQMNGNNLFPADLKLFENNGNTMLSLLSLARQCQQQAGEGAENSDAATAAAAAAAAALLLNNSNLGENSLTLIDSQNDQSASSSNSSSSILNQHFASRAANTGSNASDASSSDLFTDSGLADLMVDVVGGSPPPAKSARLECGSTRRTDANDSGYFHSTSANSGVSSNRRRNAASASLAPSNGDENMTVGAFLTSPHRASLVQLQKKTARVNNIFNKLSHKAAAAASSTTPPPGSASNGNDSNGHLSQNSQIQYFASPLSSNQSTFNKIVEKRKKQISSVHLSASINTVAHQLATFKAAAAVANEENNNKCDDKCAEGRPKLISVETQTDSADDAADELVITDLQNDTEKDAKTIVLDSEDGELVVDVEEATGGLRRLEVIRPSACLGGNNHNTIAGGATMATTQCGCRIIKVCCCSEETCARRRPSLASSSSLASVEK